MRIVIVTDSVVRNNGQGRVNYELAMGCLSRGHQVVLVSERVDETLLAAGATWVKIKPILTRPAILRVWEFTRRADRAVARLRAPGDIVVANGFTLRRPHDINVVHFVHDAWAKSAAHESRGQRGALAWYRTAFSRCNARWEKQAFSSARLVIGVSEPVRQDVLKLGYPASKVKSITNGVDLQEFSPGPADRAALGLPAGVPVALFVGDINTRRKNLDTVLEALTTVPGLHVAVAASTERSTLPAMAEALGLANRVHFLGFRRDIPDLMRASDFFIFPSRYECCSLVLLEALASGLPVITARTAACEVISESCGVVLDDPNDKTGLASAMARFTSDADLRRRTAQAARAKQNDTPGHECLIAT